jgi:hypothetical protein
MMYHVIGRAGVPWDTLLTTTIRPIDRAEGTSSVKSCKPQFYPMLKNGAVSTSMKATSRLFSMRETLLNVKKLKRKPS